MITFKQVNEDANFIKNILKVDVESYSKHLRGSEKSLTERFKANKQSYILAYHGLEIIGYICFFPISKTLSQKMQTENKCFDDDIEPKDILSESIYNQTEEDVTVFLISVAVMPHYKGKGIGKELMNKFFAFLSDKIQSGCKIRNVISYAYSPSGATLLTNYRFTSEKKLVDPETKLPVYMMRYAFDDFKKANLLMFVPFHVDEKKGKFIRPNQNTPEKAQKYINQLESVSTNEFRAKLTRKLNREYVGHEEFIIVNDDGTKVLTTRECDIYITFYKNNYVASLHFEKLGIDVTTLINQASTHQLLIKTAEKPRISLKEYLAKKFELHIYDVKFTGKIRLFTSLIKKPTDVHLAHILACESYTNSSVDTHLTSNDYLEKCRRNISQYDFSEIYISEHNVVYALKDPEHKRFEFESLMIYILELLSLQFSAINSSYTQIIDAMSKTNFDPFTIEYVNMRFSKGANLWNVNNFVYPAAQSLYENIAKEFGLPRLKAEHRENLSTFEKLTTMTAQKQIKRSSKITQIYFMIFTIISGISTIAALAGHILDSKDGILKSTIALISGCICIGLFLSVIAFFQIRHLIKKIKQKQKRKITEREENEYENSEQFNNQAF